MDKRTYYVILGVSQGDGPNAIRSAYRDLAKKYHPDVSGDEGTRAFQEILEAYRVLADPESRRAYDERLRRRRQPGHEWDRRRAPGTDAASHAADPFDWDFGPLMVRGFVRPSYDEMYDRFVRNFTGRGIPKSEHVESLDFDLVLNVDEAIRGGVIRVAVPVFVTCDACGGTGHQSLLPCFTCRREGVIESQRSVSIGIHPMTSSGTIIEVPLEGLGIQNFFLRLHVSVEE